MATQLKTNSSKNIVAGDSIRVPFSITGVPSGVTFTKAWITFKRNRADIDASAVLIKVITSGLTITATTLDFYFDISATETALFTPGIVYLWDCQLLDNSSRISTPISDGTVVFSQGTTAATS